MMSLVKDAARKFHNAEYEEALFLYRRVQESYPEISRLFELNVALCERGRTRSSLAVTLTRQSNAPVRSGRYGDEPTLFDAEFWRIQAKQLLDELEFSQER